MSNSNTDLLLFSLTNYYSDIEKLEIVKNIIECKSKLSLRLIDWYVTNYCKQYNVVYMLTKKNKQEYFNVYLNYRSQLKAFRKILFDPFRRRDRILFHSDENNIINTTIGQLNFFRWAIDSDIIKHLETNIYAVEQDMNNRQKSTVCHADTPTKQTLSKNNVIKYMTNFKGQTLISFN